MPSQTQIRDEVTARIIKALEADHVLPWRRPWHATADGSQPGRHSNVASRKAYQGVNPLLIELHASNLGLLSRWWGTFHQWHDLGCRVRKRPANVQPGHWGCRITFFKPATKTVIDDQTGDEDEESYCILAGAVVFNAGQVEGGRANEFQVHENEGQPHAQPDFAPAEDLIVATGADIRHGGDRAYYRRPTPAGSFPNHTKGDFICLPPKAIFDPPGSFYETAVHELAHWSEPRTSWDHDRNGYALGELVAEIASCYVAAELGIPQGEGLRNHAAYLRSWLEAMKGDRNYIWRASRQASKVTDFLLGFVKKPEPEAVEVVQ